MSSFPPPLVPPSNLPPASDLLITAVVTTSPAPPAVEPEREPTIEPAIEPAGAQVVDALPTLPPVGAAPAPDPSKHSATVGDDVHVRCPNCETVWEGSDLRPHAQWFCGKCDYPLFWALPPKADATAGGPEGDGALARLPGTDGRETLSSLACPHCGERNPPDPTRECLRCGLPLTVRHDVVVEPEVITIIQTQVLPPLPPRKRRIWPWIVAAAVVAAAMAAVAYIVFFR